MGVPKGKEEGKEADTDKEKSVMLTCRSPTEWFEAMFAT